MDKYLEELYKKRFPYNNSNYINQLSEIGKKNYLILYEWYMKLLITYFIQKYKLNEYDDILKASSNNFKAIDKKKMDLYQYLSSDYLSYYYLRNNLYLERLTREELNILKIKAKNKDLTIDSFIENTYQKVIIESNNNININYGPDALKFYAPSNSIVIGIRYDEFYKDENMADVDWSNQYNMQLFQLDIINGLLKTNMEKITDCKINVIHYNDYSVNSLEDEF